MKQTTRSLVSLLALVLAAGAVAAVAYWANRDEQKKTEAKEQAEKLIDAKREEVRGVRLEKEGRLSVALERDGANAPWAIAAPVRTAADETAASGLVDAALGLRQKRELGEDGDPKAYGLDAPRLRLTLKLANGRETGVEFGADNAFDQTVFVRRSGEKTVRALDGWTKTGLDKSLFDLRDKRVAGLEPGVQVTRLEVGGVKEPWAVVRDGTGWKFGAGGGAADGATVERVVSALQSLRATAVAAESAALPAQYGLSPARVTAKVETAGGARTLEFGQLVAGVGTAVVKTYARRSGSPVVYEIDGQILKDLDKTRGELEDRQLVHAGRDAVQRLVLLPAGGERLEVARRREAARDGGHAGETFELVPPRAGRQARAWKVSGALYSLSELRAASFAGPAPVSPKELAARGLDHPDVAELYGDHDQLLARVKVGGATRDGARRYVLVDGLPKLAEVEKSALAELPWKLDDLSEPAAGPDGGSPQAAK